MLVFDLHLKMMSCTKYVLGSALKSRKTVENLLYKVPILMNLTQLHKEAMNKPTCKQRGCDICYDKISLRWLC